MINIHVCLFNVFFLQKQNVVVCGVTVLCIYLGQNQSENSVAR